MVSIMHPFGGFSPLFNLLFMNLTLLFSVHNQTFTLEFHFEPNSYFSNAVLTKLYKMKSVPDATDPFAFEGPEIVDCEG